MRYGLKDTIRFLRSFLALAFFLFAAAMLWLGAKLEGDNINELLGWRDE
jgi:hypothetical protein